ncbi:hypothetical protein ACFQZI_09195 [Mucilaginibacter lutimaris]|uniref:PLAT domain-containing protein n=1 Tax=Mucilaginibacter lutimaris TaxID=931629 RepID=A0ABW2ZFQ7_9SPHI
MVLFVALTGCKKDTTGADPATYDVTNKIFRVHSTTDANTPFNVTITQSATNSISNVIAAKQNNGGDFNYGFTPQIGSTITVKVQANKAINCYVFYAGANYGIVNMTKTADGTFEGEMTKSITQ